MWQQPTGQSKLSQYFFFDTDIIKPLFELLKYRSFSFQAFYFCRKKQAFNRNLIFFLFFFQPEQQAETGRNHFFLT